MVKNQKKLTCYIGPLHRDILVKISLLPHILLLKSKKVLAPGTYMTKNCSQNKSTKINEISRAVHSSRYNTNFIKKDSVVC